MELWSSGWFGNDDLVDFQDGDGGFGGQLDGCLFGLQVVVDLEIGDGFNVTGDDLNSVGTGLVGDDELGDDVVGVQTGVLGEDSGDDLEGLGESAVGVLVESGDLFGFVLEFNREDLNEWMSTVSVDPAPGQNPPSLIKHL